ncbi:MAG: GTPase domain-containing protein [Firmicutes bacterium]|nr:GTPase domain-containing protein [Bacillota bacterium]
MRQVLILGQTNVGKTLFTLNFAAYLGIRKLAITFRDSRSSYTKEFSLEEALLRFVSKQEHQTRSLQSITIALAKGKTKRHLQLVDSVGLVDQIHPDPAVREAMGITLSIIPTGSHFLHMIDASRSTAHCLLDYQLAQFGSHSSSYALIANKWDLIQERGKLKELQTVFPGKLILPVSSLHRTGFKEVKAYVRCLL